MCKCTTIFTSPADDKMPNLNHSYLQLFFLVSPLSLSHIINYILPKGIRWILFFHNQKQIFHPPPSPEWKKHRMAEVGRDLWRSCSPNSLLKEGTIRIVLSHNSCSVLCQVLWISPRWHCSLSWYADTGFSSFPLLSLVRFWFAHFCNFLRSFWMAALFVTSSS